MLSALRTHRYVEYISLTLGILVPTMMIIAGYERVAPYLLIGIPIVFLVLYFSTFLKGSFVLLYVLAGITFLENDPGIQTIEIPFYGLNVLLALYLIQEILRGNLKITTPLDKLFFLFLILLPYAIIIGVLNGAATYTAIGEVTSFFGILIYFPARKYLSNEQFRKLLFVVLLIIIAYVLIRNAIYYRQILLQALLPWQAQKARVAANEVILLCGSCLFMSMSALTKHRVIQLVSTFVFLGMVAGLILTQSRGYWLAFAFGAFMIFSVSDKNGKRRIITTFIIVCTSSLLIGTLFFGDLLQNVASGLAERFQSLGSTKLDASLQERVNESKTVLGIIAKNPIAGSGMGYLYTQKILLYDYFIRTSYVHNGYLSIWFKLGILGILTLIGIWGLTFNNARRLYHSHTGISSRIIFLSIVGIISGMALVNITSPQVSTFEGMLITTLAAAYISSCYAHKTSVPDNAE